MSKRGRGGVSWCVRVLHQAVWPDDPGREDSSGRLRGPVGSADDGEDDGGRTAHHAEERLLVDILRSASHWSMRVVRPARCTSGYIRHIRDYLREGASVGR